MMEVRHSQSKTARNATRGRPAQALYMPPARRKLVPTKSSPKSSRIEQSSKQENFDEELGQQTQIIPSNILTTQPLTIETMSYLNKSDTIVMVDEPHSMEKILTNKLDNNKEVQPSTIPVLQFDDLKLNDEQTSRKQDKVKHVKPKDVKCGILQISVAKNVKKSPIKLVQDEVDQWEDLFNDDGRGQHDDDGAKRLMDNGHGVDHDNDLDEDDDDDENQDIDSEHILEIYDFPATFKAVDIMQIYGELDPNTIYIKWLNDTRALLVLGSAMQAKRALSIETPFVKARPAALGSGLARDAVRSCSLRPAMRRPQTSMHAARRMITTALGAKNTVSREVQQREKEALRRAKEERRTQRQNERDAWDGNPRPTTA